MSISLITVCFNNSSTITDTVKSVEEQSLSQFEYLIKDGGSTDGTVSCLKSERISLVVSEKDSGLYDALNRSIHLTKGSIVGFIHSDDKLASNNVLLKIQKTFDETGADAVYGDLNYVSSDLSKVIRKWKSGEPGSFKTGWMPPHPTLYVKRQVFEKIGFFRTDIGSAADYEWMLRAIHVHRIKLAYIPEVLVNMRVGGMSNESTSARTKAFSSDLKAWEVNGLGKNYFAVILKKLRKLPQYL